jgi:hypothetical protein
VNYLVARGFVVLRRNVTTVKFKDRYVNFGQRGQADLYGKTPEGAGLPGGVHVEIEVKRPGERPTQAQVDWLVKMNGRGRDRSVAFWADNLPSLVRIVDAVLGGARVVYDLGPGSEPGDFHLEYQG